MKNISITTAVLILIVLLTCTRLRGQSKQVTGHFRSYPSLDITVSLKNDKYVIKYSDAKHKDRVPKTSDPAQIRDAIYYNIVGHLSTPDHDRAQVLVFANTFALKVIAELFENTNYIGIVENVNVDKTIWGCHATININYVGKYLKFNSSLQDQCSF